MLKIEHDGTEYRMNRFGVVFAPSTPDPHLTGFANINFAETDTTHAVIAKAIALGATLKRYDSHGPVYDLSAARAALREAARAAAKQVA